MSNEEGPNSTGILYQYQNHASKVEIVGGSVSDIANRISKDLEAKNEDMSVVLVGVDALWDVALMKFIYEFTSCLLYTSPSPRDRQKSRMPSSA